MRVAIVHYHLRPGGVTRVIQNALTAIQEVIDQDEFRDFVRCAVLAGEPPSPDMPVPSSAVIKSLGYSTSTNSSATQIRTELETTARRLLGGLPDLWHIHNHALGKNLILPQIVTQLVREGQHVLLQPHDFAEDGRPENYAFLRRHLGQDNTATLGSHLYPQGAHVHYALINQRDLHFLRASGVRETQLHYLPNAVSAQNESVSESSAKPSVEGRLFFYPARAIRRKNIGEFLLWAALAEKGDIFGIARAPKNPVARPVYDAWVALAQQLKLPVQFGLGEQWQGSFSDLLKSAHALVSTSVAEGFGLAFLEPWLMERPLVGRKLPEITDEFERTGLDLSGLYEQLRVPLQWVGSERFRQVVRTELCRVYTAYGKTASETDVERAVAAAVGDHGVPGHWIDIGHLNEPMQQTVIERLAQSPTARTEVTPAKVTFQMPEKQSIQHNRQIVEEHFHLQEYGRRLLDIYRTVLDSEVTPADPIDADRLLEQFLAPERFCLLRT